MSYHVFFSMSVGLKGPMLCPKGTLKRILDEVKATEEALGLGTTQYENNPPSWDRYKNRESIAKVTDKVLCKTAMDHNAFVIYLYQQFGEWSKTPPVDGETITPEQAATFWHGLEMITVPPERWTREFYVSKMEHLYEVMRGQESQGVSFGERPLTSKQAAQVVNIFSEYLDKNDCRLDVPKGHDYLASSYDGGYNWCEKCGAVTSDTFSGCTRSSKSCPLKAEYYDEEDLEDEKARRRERAHNTRWVNKTIGTSKKKKIK